MRLSSIHLGILTIALLATPSGIAASLSDISGNPHESAIDSLYKRGMISGYPDGSFRPEQTVNRAELLKILAAREGVRPEADTYRDCFPDVTTEWFAPYVCYAKEQSWVNGYPDGTFRPGNTVNTAEAIKIVMIAIGFHPNKSSVASSIVGVEPGAWYTPYVEAAFAHRILENKGAAFDAGKDMSRADVATMVYRSLLQEEGSDWQEHSLLGSVRRGGGGGTRTNTSDIHIPVIIFADIGKTYGDPSFTLSALSNSLGHITYSSSNTNVATINGSTVTIVGAGNAIITATQAANGRFAEHAATAALTVNGIAPTITFNNLTKSHIDANFTLTPTSNSPGAFTFATGNASLVTISGDTADIIGTSGTATITATQAASGNYAAGSATMTLTVFATYCVAEPCLNGSACVPTLGGNGAENFLCTCVNDHYAGVYCEESDLNCYDNGGDLYCNNGGSCVKDIDGGICDCAGGFCGTYCQILPSQCGV